MKRHLMELKRFDMIDRTRVLSQARYDRRRNYVAKVSHYAGSREYKNLGNFSVLMDIGDHRGVIEFREMKKLVDERHPDKVPSRDQIRNILAYALDNLDIKVYCTCPDFKYRFHYVVTKLDGLPSGAPAQNVPTVVTNPLAQGFLCKHLTAVLAKPSTWMSRAVTLLRDSILIDRGERDEE